MNPEPNVRAPKNPKTKGAARSGMTRAQAALILNQLDHLSGNMERVVKLELTLTHQSNDQKSSFDSVNQKLDKLEKRFEAFAQHTADKQKVEKLEALVVNENKELVTELSDMKKRLSILEAFNVKIETFTGLVKWALGLFGAAIVTGIAAIIKISS